jgi:rfaE bifunctional protein nucleotidyltransferase chain/domain
MHRKIVEPRIVSDRVGPFQIGLRKDRLVFTNGCFDLLHYGHVHMLQMAKQLGSLLCVAVNSDETVRTLKGENRPIFNIHQRAHMLEALECVDYVIIQKDYTPRKLLEQIQPDFLVKGDQYGLKDVVGYEIVQSYGGRIIRLPMVEGCSTSLTHERIYS